MFSVRLSLSFARNLLMTQTLDSAPILHRACDILDAGVLRAHYQPIIQLKDGKVVAHESLIRMPAHATLRSPDEFFKAARAEGLTVRAEQACLEEGMRSWAEHKPDTRLFLNLSAFAIIEMVDRLTVPGVLRALHAASISPSALVIEITEHEHVSDLPRLIATATALRATGLRFALDNFGDGRSSLRLWAELPPEIVKVDKYFIHDVAIQPIKVQTLRGLTRLAETFGTKLVAEGIETEDELLVVRDLGIEAEDRHGVTRFFKCTTLSIGAVPMRPGPSCAPTRSLRPPPLPSTRRKVRPEGSTSRAAEVRSSGTAGRHVAGEIRCRR